jgi:hypothetical protein
MLGQPKGGNATLYEVIFTQHLPYFSKNLKAFSRKDGLPSISSNASRIGRPTTSDLIGLLSLPVITKYVPNLSHLT